MVGKIIPAWIELERTKHSEKAQSKYSALRITAVFAPFAQCS
jgi:hypothetical protein